MRDRLHLQFMSCGSTAGWGARSLIARAVIALAVLACSEDARDTAGRPTAGEDAPASASDRSQAGTQSSAPSQDKTSTGTSGGGASGSSAAGTAGGDAGSGRDAGSTVTPGNGRGCEVDGQSFADGEEDLPAADGCNVCVCRDGELQQCTMADCMSPCVVARHMDQCCAPFEPVRRKALEADECLYAYPALLVDREREQRCIAKRGSCAAFTCPIDSRAPSRVAESDDAGGCRYLDECASAGDCVLAFAEGRCCECRSSVPVALVEANRCVVSELAEISPNCRDCSPPVLCEQCAPPGPPTCVARDAFSRCE